MKIDDDLVGPAKVVWHRLIERTAPLRPDLFRYCRSLTGSVWDAEDLVQDTMMRAFARLSQVSDPIRSSAVSGADLWDISPKPGPCNPTAERLKSTCRRRVGTAADRFDSPR